MERAKPTERDLGDWKDFRRYRAATFLGADDAPPEVRGVRMIFLLLVAWIIAILLMWPINALTGIQTGIGSASLANLTGNQLQDLNNELSEASPKGPKITLTTSSEGGTFRLLARADNVTTLNLIVIEPGGGQLLPGKLFDLFFRSTVTITTPVSPSDLEKVYVLLAAKNENTGDDAQVAEKAGAVGRLTEKFLEGHASRVRIAQRFNGPIQFITLWLFSLLLLLCLVRWWCNVAPNERLRRITQVGPSRVRAPWKRTSDKSGKLLAEYGLVFDRISKQANTCGTNWTPAFLEVRRSAHAAFNVAGNYGEIPSFVSAQVSSLLDRLYSSAALLRYLIWAIPTVGFVGTVVGIGDALYLTRGMGSVDEITRALSRSEVSASIGVAFDTTLVALLLSLVGMLLYNMVSQMEEGVVLRTQKETLMGFLHLKNIAPDERTEPFSRMVLKEVKHLKDHVLSQGKQQRRLGWASKSMLTGCLLAIIVFVVGLVAVCSDADFLGVLGDMQEWVIDWIDKLH